ncbi:MAG: hypothetical protein ACLP22_19590 [Solirubrobacteraceae bacterium]
MQPAIDNPIDSITRRAAAKRRERELEFVREGSPAGVRPWGKINERKSHVLRNSSCHSFAGCVVETISGGAINGPWDLTAVDEGNQTVLFVTNGQSVDGGTVVRIVLRTDGSNVPTVTSERIIARGLQKTTGPSALDHRTDRRRTWG